MIKNRNVKFHLVKSLEKGIRYDGRSLDKFRDVNVEYGVTKTAEGSALVSIGDTKVMAGITLELIKPYDDSPNEGTLMVNAEFLPMASKRFEMGPPSMDSIELARVIDRGIRESDSIDFAKLCIVPGEQVWSVCIDLMTINDAGNLLDAAGLAALAALKDAKLPLVEDGVVNYKEKTKVGLPLEKHPVSITIHMVGENIVADPLKVEEDYSDARLTVAAVDHEIICAMQKGGAKGLTRDQTEAMVDLALAKGEELRGLLQ